MARTTHLTPLGGPKGGRLKPTSLVLAVLALLMNLAALSPPALAEDSDRGILSDPIRLKADGEYIDTGEYVAHSGPSVMDINKDGLPDLLVGNFRGHIHVFENRGTRTRPELTDKGFLQAEGETVKIKNW